MTPTQLFVIGAIALPAIAFVLWPLLRRGLPATVLPMASAAEATGLELQEEKTAVYRALRELTFDHEAGHLSDDDFQALRDRYEARAAEILTALDRLPPAVPERPRDGALRPDSGARRGWTRNPVTLGIGAIIVLVFGVALGLGLSRFTEPDQTAVSPGSRLPAPIVPGSSTAGGDTGASGGPPGETSRTGRPIPPEMLAGMLGAARQSLLDGRYQEAIAAYQAVLKRDPLNVDAMTHLGLIVAIGGHADAALETFDRVLEIDADYSPAHLYRGQVLYETKRDYAGAITAWERFLALAPQGEERDRVAALVVDARTKQRAR